jgi:predicted MPP superfamily phosphohydrolase
MLILSSFILITLSGIVYAVIISTWFPRVRKVNLTYRAQSSGEWRIIHLTDLHIARIGVLEKRALRKINNLDCDVIVITGDLLKHRVNDYEAAISFLSQIKHTVPILVIRGNAEFCHINGKDPLADIAKLPNVTLLSNQAFELRKAGATPLCFLGIDPYFETCQPFSVQDATDDGVLIQGGGSWNDCYFVAKQNGGVFDHLSQSPHFEIHGSVRLASEGDLAGILIYHQNNQAQRRFYRLTFGNAPVRWSGRGTRLQTHRIFSKTSAPSSEWFDFSIEVRREGSATKLRAYLGGEAETISFDDESGKRLVEGSLGFWTSRQGDVRRFRISRLVDHSNGKPLNLSSLQTEDFVEVFEAKSPWNAPSSKIKHIAPFLDDALTSQENAYVLLCHDPELLDVMVQGEKFDFVLAGHTHGGQIRLLRLLRLIYGKSVEKWKALQKQFGDNLIISNGLGTSGFPFRFGARAEIVYVSLQ